MSLYPEIEDPVELTPEEENMYKYIQNVGNIVKERRVSDCINDFLVDIQGKVENVYNHSTHELSFIDLCRDPHDPSKVGSIPLPEIYKVPAQKGIYRIVIDYTFDVSPYMSYTPSILFLRQSEIKTKRTLLKPEYNTISPDAIECISNHQLAPSTYRMIHGIGRLYLDIFSDRTLYFENKEDVEGEIVIYRCQFTGDYHAINCRLRDVLPRKFSSYTLQQIQLEQMKKRKRMLDFVTERAENFTIFSGNDETREYWEYQNRLEGLEEFEELAEGLW